MSTPGAEEILGFRFATEDGIVFGRPREVRFSKDKGFDQEIRECLAGAHEQGAVGVLDHWKEASRRAWP